MTGVHRSEAWLQAHQRRVKGGDRFAKSATGLDHAVTGAAHPTKRGNAEGSSTIEQRVTPTDAGSTPAPKPKRGMNKRKGPNKTEAAFGAYLLLMGDGHAEFEAMTLKMPGGTRYTPDWCVHGLGRQLTFYEVKAWTRYMREASRVRLKEFAAHFRSFRFYLVFPEDRRLLTWSITEVK